MTWTSRLLLLGMGMMGMAHPGAQAADSPGLWKAKTLKECDGFLRETPRGYACYSHFATRTGRGMETLRHLEGRLQLAPRDPLRQLSLGRLLLGSDADRAEQLLTAAAQALRSSAEHEREAWALIDLSEVLRGQHRLKEASARLDEAGAAAAASGDARLILYVDAHRALQLAHSGDFGTAFSLFTKVQSEASASRYPHLESLARLGQGKVAFTTAKYVDAVRFYLEAATLSGGIEDYLNEAGALRNASLAASQATARGQMDASARSEIEVRSRLATARHGSPAHRAEANFMEAQNPAAPVARKLALLEEALALYEKTHDWRASQVMRFLATVRRRADRNDPEAARVLERAFELARQSGDQQEMARCLLHRAQWHREAGEPSGAAVDSLAVLDEVERVRDSQLDGSMRAGFTASWAWVYYLAAWDQLMGGGPDGSPAPEVSFAVTERVKARVLLDLMDRAEADTGGAEGPSRTRRDAILKQISRVQRRLIDPYLAPGERSAFLSTLDRLESDEAALRVEMAREDPRFASLRNPLIPTVAQVQSALEPDEALLSFQVFTAHRDLPSWVFVLTRDRITWHDIPAGIPLQREVELYLGQIERRDGTEGIGASHLHDELMRDALADLPGNVSRLVIIPDGPLHQLPFDTLLAAPLAEALAARYEITIAPSAAILMRWRATPPPIAPRTVLSLADPELEAASVTAPGSLRASTLASGLQLAPLPWARAEARALAEGLGGGRVVVGPDATEAFVKSAPLRDYQLLHVAAHAVVDDRHPERSGILLAPGADAEDGLLQIREIVELDLKGRVVILSSCRSASGAVLEGEGVLGLARAFFQAGAVTVVGSLWPLRDEDGERLVTSMGRHLASGRTMAGAMAAARRDLMRAGLPAAAWSGLVVLGDGDVVPLPNGRGLGRSEILLAACSLLMFAAGAALVWRGRPGAVPGAA